MIDFVAATADYEAWAAPLDAGDLACKHAAMAQRPFAFLRASFYRWAQICDLDGPRVLAVGDLHLENFGTWRDLEGRLIWGINDFDEAAALPYSHDLARLAASALLARREGRIGLDRPAIAASILEGYTKSLLEGGRPYVLEETHGWMRALALSSLRDPPAYWAKLAALPTAAPRTVPPKVRKLFARALPGLDYRIAPRRAGLGSLGRPRFVALAEHEGGAVAREAKALLPSAVAWARPKDAAPIRYAEILAGAVRCPDPFLAPTGKWVLRRLAADCSKLDLALLPRRRDERRLLRAMGWETANIHLGTRGAARAIRRDLDRRPARWLDQAAAAMAQAVLADWQAWRRAYSRAE